VCAQENHESGGSTDHRTWGDLAWFVYVEVFDKHPVVLICALLMLLCASLAATSQLVLLQVIFYVVIALLLLLAVCVYWIRSFWPSSKDSLNSESDGTCKTFAIEHTNPDAWHIVLQLSAGLAPHFRGRIRFSDENGVQHYSDYARLRRFLLFLFGLKKYNRPIIGAHATMLRKHPLSHKVLEHADYLFSVENGIPKSITVAIGRGTPIGDRQGLLRWIGCQIQNMAAQQATQTEQSSPK